MEPARDCNSPFGNLASLIAIGVQVQGPLTTQDARRYTSKHMPSQQYQARWKTLQQHYQAGDNFFILLDKHNQENRKDLVITRNDCIINRLHFPEKFSTTILPLESHEACFVLSTNEGLYVQYNSSQESLFNIHYHKPETNQEIYLIKNTLTTSSSHKISTPHHEFICVMWHNIKPETIELHIEIDITYKKLHEATH